MRHKGSSIIEYIIPLALIGIVAGLTITYFVTNGTLLNFFSGTSNATTNTSTGTMVLNQNPDNSGALISELNNSASPQAGSLGGTPQAPVKQCQGSNCNIDFGDFILSGIPSDYDEFVESAGNSGTTDQLASLFQQIADQLETQGDTFNAQRFKDMANLGHFIGDFQENILTEISLDVEAMKNGTIKLVQDQNHMADLPAEVAHLLPDYQKITSGKTNTQNLAFNNTFLGIVDTSASTSNAGGALAAIYGDIMNDSNVGAELKATTKQIFNAMNTNSQDFYDNVYHFQNGGPYETDYFIDNAFKNLTKPDSSNIANLNSSILCASAGLTDDGNSCGF